MANLGFSEWFVRCSESISQNEFRTFEKSSFSGKKSADVIFYDEPKLTQCFGYFCKLCHQFNFQTMAEIRFLRGGQKIKLVGS